MKRAVIFYAVAIGLGMGAQRREQKKEAATKTAGEKNGKTAKDQN